MSERQHDASQSRMSGIEVEGITVWVGRGADVAMVAAIVHALKASR
ncbi:MULTISPECIES: hypothetical protein [unclassified Bradyrhizobium]|nr:MULTISPECIES: hypothetical protein [unclassified Bradyrhizobium]MCK1540103.1 hypothetical protein [Bradyrhizobium sp. 176]MCK1560705.1 hypothetical protein [Bradyrhizobium sp. 171]